MKRALSTLTILLLTLASGAGAASLDPPVRNWAVPGISADGRTALSDLTGGPILFMPITPCRLADTRSGSGFSGQWGPPSIAGGGTQRTFTITGQCGIPSAANAVSFNFAVWGPSTRGDLRVFPAGGGAPLVSTLNWEAGILALANAAIVPLGAGGAITLQVDGAGTVDIFFDVNGYYIAGSGTGLNPGEAVEIRGNTDPSTYGLLFAQNFSTRAGDPYVAAIRGYITNSPNGSGVAGIQAAGTGANFGVRGENASTTLASAGILGVSGGRPLNASSFYPTGVRGESTGSRNGVLGLIENTGGGFAVAGFTLDGSGNIVLRGRLGDAFSSLGVSYDGGLGGSGTKSFLEPHATDPTKMIRYVSLEGPEAGTYFRGRGRFVNRMAVIEVPESFRMVTDGDGLTVQITPIGRIASVGVVSMDLNQIVAESSRDVEFSYLVQGVRRAYRDVEVITRNTHFVPDSPDARMPASYSSDERRRLIENGTYNADGTVNMATAEKMGWAQKWRDEERSRTEAAQQSLNEAKPGQGVNGQ